MASVVNAVSNLNKLANNATTIAKVGEKVIDVAKTGTSGANPLEDEGYKEGDHMDQAYAEAAADALAHCLMDEDPTSVTDEVQVSLGPDGAPDIFSPEYYEEKLQQNPEDVATLLSLAQLQYTRGEYTEAVNNTATVMDLDPDSVQAYNIMGSCLLKQQKFEEAIAAYEMGLRLTPNNSTMRDGIVESIDKFNEMTETMSSQIDTTGGCGYCSWCLRFIIPAEKASNLLLTMYKCPLEDCARWTKRCAYCRNFSCWDSYICEADGKKISQKDLTCLNCQGSVLTFRTLDRKIHSLEQAQGIYCQGFQPWKSLKSHIDTIAVSAVSPPLALAYAVVKPDRSKRNLKVRDGIACHRGTRNVLNVPVGGPAGAYVASLYCASMNKFRFRQVRQGRRPIIVTVNGFLTDDEDTFQEWRAFVNLDRYRDREWWHLNWDSCNVVKATAVGAARTGAATIVGGLVGILGGAAGSVTLGTTAGSVTMARHWSKLFYETYVAAEKMGAVLADALARMKGNTFVLMGHSLGCHVIREALVRLAESDIVNIETVVLISGATDNDADKWRIASEAVKGRIHNYYSENDLVLRNLLPLVKKTKIVSPIGRHAIANVDRVINHHSTDIITAHMSSKQQVLRGDVSDHSRKDSHADAKGATSTAEASAANAEALEESECATHTEQRRERPPAEDLAPLY